VFNFRTYIFGENVTPVAKKVSDFTRRYGRHIFLDFLCENTAKKADKITKKYFSER
jgi:hypothetical protein